MRIKRTLINFSGAALVAAGALYFQSCHNTNAATGPNEKKHFVLPDSLIKTLVIDPVKMEGLINAITLTGQVDVNQDRQVNIFSLVSGNIQDIKVQLGDYVMKGQGLAVVKSSEMAGYTNNLVIARTNLVTAKKQLDATQSLYKSGLASVLDLTSAQAGYDQATAQLEMVKRVLTINGNDTSGNYIIKSPINGFVVQKFATNAQSIRPDNSNPLFTISDLKDVWVWANVYESNVGKIHKGDDVDVSTISYPGRIFKGKVDKVLNVLDSTNKVMKALIILPNPGYDLKPQMFANVTVINQVKQQAICIPSSALIFDHSQYFVLVYHSNSDIGISPVEVIGSIGNKTYLSSGVKAGDSIISSQPLLIYEQLNN